MKMQIFLPEELADDEQRIRRFFDAMIFKLRKNAHKKGLTASTVEEGMRLLEGEVVELHAAIDEGSSIEILMEAADVANFALIASVAAVEGELKADGGLRLSDMPGSDR